MKVNTEPYPIASVVGYKGKEYLVDNVRFLSGEPIYSLLGHRCYGSHGRGIAWIDHKDLEQVMNGGGMSFYYEPFRGPSVYTWANLMEAKEKAGVF